MSRPVAESTNDLFKTAHIAVGSFEFDAKGMRAIVGTCCRFRALPSQGSQKQGICYDREPRNPVRGVQEFRRVLSEIGCHDRLWHYGCCRENDPDQWCCDKRCASNCKGCGACLAREHFKSSEAKHCPQNTTQNLQASDRPPEGRLIQRRAYGSGRLLLIANSRRKMRWRRMRSTYQARKSLRSVWR
jgi:hypothetical protein